MNGLFTPPVIVVGTGRSGTSLVSGILHKLGVDMGQDFVPTDNNNISGTFEDVDFTALNRMALTGSMPEDKFKKEARKLIQLKGIKGKRWGWKYPSTSSLVDVYSKIVPKAKYIWCTRPLSEFIDSCSKAYGWDEEKSKKVFNHRTEKLTQYLQTDNTLQIQFREILNHPKRVIGQLIDYLELDVTKAQIEAANELVFDKSKTKNAKILIALQSSRLDMHTSTHRALMQLQEDERYETTQKIYHGQPISHVRNQIAYDASEYDFVLMLDPDVRPTKNPLDLVKLNKDIIGLPTPIYHAGKLMFNAMAQVGENFRPIPGDMQEGLMQIDAVGTGCILIKSEVFSKINNPFGILLDKKGLKTRGEDFAFSVRARENGYKVWTHFDYPCEHWNRLDMLKILRALNGSS